MLRHKVIGRSGNSKCAKVSPSLFASVTRTDGAIADSSDERDQIWRKQQSTRENCGRNSFSGPTGRQRGDLGVQFETKPRAQEAGGNVYDKKLRISREWGGHVESLDSIPLLMFPIAYGSFFGYLPRFEAIRNRSRSKLCCSGSVNFAVVKMGSTKENPLKLYQTKTVL